MAQDDLLLEALGARTRGRHGPAVFRPALLRALTDLFVGARHHYPEEIRQFQEIGLLLLETADETLRGFVAENLAPHRDVPPVLLERLVQLGGNPAANLACVSTTSDVPGFAWAISTRKPRST